MTLPHLDAPYSRQRLFALLDAERRRPVIWVAGPPGSGKTTLAATWLEARGLPGLWYQLDPDDSDAATFFDYLRRAARAADVRADSLPLLTSAHGHDIPAFARRWFRELFTVLPAGAVVVLDNYQDVDAGSVLHLALAVASEEVPADSQLLVLSWSEPPHEFSRALVRERLARVPPDALRLTLDEARGIVAARNGLTDAQVRELHAQCHGWAAGFTLLRERTRRTGLVNDTRQTATMQEVFDYFMTLVFRDARVESREALLVTALLPRFTEAMAVQMSGDPAVGRLLEPFYRRHLFIERTYGPEVTYEYHGLFRAFLRDQAARHYAPGALSELLHRAAAVLRDAGWLEDALALLLETHDQDAAVSLAEQLAPGLVAAGRGATLEGVVARLPPSAREGRPILSYWRGAALAYTNLPESRAAFEQAYAGFVRNGDRTGQAMAAGGMLQLHLLGWSNSMNDLDAVRRLIAILEPLLEEEPKFPSADLAVRIHANVLATILWQLPHHPLLPLCVRRVEALLQEPFEEDDVRVRSASQLIEYYALAGYVHEADRVADAIEQVARSPRISPVTRCYWLTWSSRRSLAAGDLVAARRRNEEAVTISAAERLGRSGAAAVAHFLASITLANAALDIGDLDTVRSIVAALASDRVASGGPQIIAALRGLQAKLAAASGDLEEALQHAHEACTASGTQMVLGLAAYLPTLVSIQVERGEHCEARRALEQLEALYPADAFPLFALRVDLLRGLLRPASDRNWRGGVAERLQRVHALGVEHWFAGQPLASRQVAELLLTEGIAVPLVRAWIRRLHPRPRSPDVPAWPWAVRIRTLGPFGIDVEDRRLTFGGKGPRKQLELLQALVAFGGEEVSSDEVSHALWPDSDGDSADAALRMALSRLRTLLRHDAIALRRGRLSLDRRFCWVDVWAFRDLCRDIERHARNGVATRLLELYRGPFLANERGAPWIFPMRERLRRQLAAAVATASRQLEDGGDEGGASTLRARARERDPAAFSRTV